jgi:hypothetical protein
MAAAEPQEEPQEEGQPSHVDIVREFLGRSVYNEPARVVFKHLVAGTLKQMRFAKTDTTVYK